VNEECSKKLGWKKDWATLVYLALALLAFFVIAYDFWILQKLQFQLYIPVIVGLALIFMGGTFRISSRTTLKKAGFNIVNSYKLQIVIGQKLVTTGIYSHIRHPLYLGEITRNLGFAVLFSSLYGFVIMVIANIFLVIRIQTEEKMLVSEFGAEYEQYKKRTKKLLPYIY